MSEINGLPDYNSRTNQLKNSLVKCNIHQVGGDYEYNSDKEPMQSYKSTIHTEEHFSALPSNLPSNKRHGWHSKTTKSVRRSSMDLLDYEIQRQSSLSDWDDDITPDLISNIPNGSLSTSIDSLSSYSQLSLHAPDTPAVLTDTVQYMSIPKRRVSTAPRIDLNQENACNKEDIPDQQFSPFATRLSQNSTRRYLPQSQAILQTDIHGNIIGFNETAVLLFGTKQSLLNMNALDLLEPNFKLKYFSNLLDKFAHTRPERDSLQNGNDDKPYTTVLLCGKVVPIITQDQTDSAASLWLKEKHNSNSDTIYVWIFEELSESMIIVHMNSSAVIKHVDGEVQDLYGLKVADVIGRSIECLMPTWVQMRLASDSGFYDMTHKECESSTDASMRSDHRRLDIDRINASKFFGSQNANKMTFPVMTRIQDSKDNQDIHIAKIISMPTVAGLFTILRNGTVKSSNAAFTRYLFGYDLSSILDQNIAKLLPQFPHLFLGLQAQKRLRAGEKLSHETCYSIYAKYSPSATYFADTSHGNNYFLAVHRDSTILQIQLQLKTINSDEIALWIEFDRRKKPYTTQPNIKVDTQQYESASMVQEGQLETLQVAKSEVAIPVQPARRPKPLGNVSSFGAAIKKVVKVQDPADMQVHRYTTDDTPSAPRAPNSLLPRRISFATVVAPHVKGNNLPKYSAQTHETCIDDYVILDSFGQGAYGVVKLARHKTNPDQPRVVIKYVVKSRILVDCWTRDRILGMLPLEIHTLHTLRRIPHPNICEMVDYFEDDDHYYIVMNLHGDGVDLFDFIELNQQVSEDDVRFIFRQVAEAVQHLHHNKIVHRDIKDENVIIDNNLVTRLIDFGSAAYVKPERMFETFCGTLDYAAPEILNGSKYAGPPQDVWSLGILLYTLVFKENPFYNIDQAVSRQLPKLGQDVSAWHGPTDLMQRMLNLEIDLRPTIDQVLAHPWLQTP